MHSFALHYMEVEMAHDVKERMGHAVEVEMEHADAPIEVYANDQRYCAAAVYHEVRKLVLGLE